MTWSNAMYMNSGNPCNFEDFSDGYIAIFVGKVDTPLFNTQYGNYQDVKLTLKNLHMEVLFVSDTNSDTEHEHHVWDKDRSIINLSDELAKRDEVSEWLFIIKKDGADVELVYSHKKPENELNWFEFIKQFSLNTQNDEADSDNLWRVGQTAPQTGEYLCVDCGYIEEFKEGDVFPVCEVCLSGDPDGPSPIEKGYWEYLG